MQLIFNSNACVIDDIDAENQQHSDENVGYSVNSIVKT